MILIEIQGGNPRLKSWVPDTTGRSPGTLLDCDPTANALYSRLTLGSTAEK